MEAKKNDLVQSKPAEIVVPQPNPDLRSNFADFAEKELSAQVIVREDCKLCNSRFRKEAEEKYARNGNALSVHRFLTDNKEDLSYNACRNHLQNHYVRPDRELRLREYAQDITSWSKIRQEKESLHQEHITILSRRIRLLESSTDDDNPESQRKTADTVTKLIEQIGKEQERIDKMKVEESPIRILFFKFEEMIKSKLENMSSPEAKVALVDILESFGQEVEEFEKNVGS